ncbi:MAG: DUF4238 domain-containing protein [Dehalococcoidia bacterium]|nr:DUF4238 domain-containing protein [Dehalococcoidia bacterium]
MDTTKDRGPKPARDNHYVPQSVLRRWSRDGDELFARRLLVSHSSVPEWQRVAVRGIGYQRDLYTSLTGSPDDFERWIAREYEVPATNAVDKVVADTRLSREDWHALARFFALQDLRTPSSFISNMKRWDREMQSFLEESTAAALREWTASNGAPTRTPDPSNHFSDTFKITVQRPSHPGGQTFIRTEITLGRKFWLDSIRHLLGGVAETLCEHQWSIAVAADGVEWPLTDHPALKLNYRSPADYDFGGGWGTRNTDLFMPLSPRHLLFTEVGRDAGRRVVLSRSESSAFRSFLVERAHRWVFATEPMDWIATVRPRLVDAEAFRQESEQWQRWHAEQSRADQ